MIRIFLNSILALLVVFFAGTGTAALIFAVDNFVELVTGIIWHEIILDAWEKMLDKMKF